MSSTADLHGWRLGMKRHPMDPLSEQGGAPPPDDDHRVNLRRVQICGLLMSLEALTEVFLSPMRGNPAFPMRHDPTLWWVAVVMTIMGVVFTLAARQAQVRGSGSHDRITYTFVVVGLLTESLVDFLIGQSDRVPLGFPMVYLAFAAFFIMPPRHFAWIGALTGAVFLCLVYTLPIPSFDKLDTGVSVCLGLMGGVLSRWSIHRIQHISRQQRLEIARKNSELAHANGMLKTRNVELNDLMAIAAHDLRSPLFGLSSLLELAKKQPPDSRAKMEQLMGAANRSVSDMLSLIGRLLEAHETEGRARTAFQRKDIGRCLTAAVRRAEPYALTSGVAITCVLPRDPVWADVDPEGLDQILDNLLSNAIRFSPSSSTIRVVANFESGRPSIEIADEGVGIAEEQRPTLFGKFRRGPVRPLHGPRGSGLGLYIVQTLAKAMDARCTYRAGGTVGSVFRIEFDG